MHRMFVVLAVVSLASTALPGCAQETEIAGDPVSVVHENINAMNSEDLEKVMATIDEESESYEATKQLAQRLFDTYDLHCELDSVRVIELTDEEAKVECVQLTKKVRGPAFRDNRIDFVHLLRKSDGKWKIYASKAKKIDYLN